jgi:hypothetical protein
MVVSGERLIRVREAGDRGGAVVLFLHGTPSAPQADEKARRRDPPDLVFFMLATGVRIGEALAAWGRRWT